VECFYDIVVQVAIIRPSRLSEKWFTPILSRRQGREGKACIHRWSRTFALLGVPLSGTTLRMADCRRFFRGGLRTSPL
jgi:hypothetical protein